MKKAAIIVVSGLILIAAFAFLIYPTPYKYMKYENEYEMQVPMRINFITGDTEIFDESLGWTKIQK
ncbi:hypothetical protein [Paenibacillus jilunlii]|uniref:Uncharacterized protein n=1 Tax=Paenibacillus jilunlii TaxID=682956 RepID=A0A1H0AD72_9BACL|nr:hypothetical protein [Paenibacillus jilunlii]KWX79911.1 hypothetical protein AML91_01715 [Paenibacillus jilunlii]SDN31264.1 hypothetical protein SAMN05216191_1379 [Paenibacillus jilunlii]